MLEIFLWCVLCLDPKERLRDCPNAVFWHKELVNLPPWRRAKNTEPVAAHKSGRIVELNIPSRELLAEDGDRSN